MLQKILTERLLTLLGDDFSSVMDAFSEKKYGFFRINSLKPLSAEVGEELKEKNIVTELFSEEEGIYRFKRDDEYALKGTDAFYQGKIYLQSLSSMLPPYVLAPEAQDNVLDVCAAPGSKTIQLSALMGNHGHIVALEKNQIRYDKLCYNIRLQGAENISAQKVDARKFLVDTEERFNKVLLDAPCSAEGRIFLGNEKSYGFWSLENIAKNHALQYDLASHAVSVLDAGGSFVYSTCTLAPEENELIIARLLSDRNDIELEHFESPLFHADWIRPGVNIVGLSRELFPLISEQEWQHRSADDIAAKTKRVLPSRNTEGFFIAKIRKK